MTTMRRIIVLFVVAALLVAMMAASAMPAMAKGKVTCYAADPDEFYALTGQKTQWGGMVCTRS